MVALRDTLGAEAQLIVDFTFNLGVGRLQTSTLRRRINQRGWHSSAREFNRWIYAGRKLLPGLVPRRKVEAAQYLYKVCTEEQKPCHPTSRAGCQLQHAQGDKHP